MRKKFDEIFEDCTKLGTKIKTDEYHSNGKHPIIDQGQEMVAGFTDLEDGLLDAVPAIVFGDHTRIIKYVDCPFFLGADGVKVLRSKVPNANYRYLYYALKNAKIPNTGYNRHYFAPADYSDGRELDTLVKAIIDRTAYNEKLETMHYKNLNEAAEAASEKK